MNCLRCGATRSVDFYTTIDGILFQLCGRCGHVERVPRRDGVGLKPQSARQGRTGHQRKHPPGPLAPLNAETPRGAA